MKEEARGSSTLPFNFTQQLSLFLFYSSDENRGAAAERRQFFLKLEKGNRVKLEKDRTLEDWLVHRLK